MGEKDDSTIKEINWSNFWKNQAEMAKWMIGVGVSFPIVVGLALEAINQEGYFTEMFFIIGGAAQFYGLALYIDIGTWRPLIKEEDTDQK